MEKEQVKEFIIQKLPIIIREDIEIKQLIVKLAEDKFADKRETSDRFDRLLAELKRDREEQSKKWDEQNHKWEENQNSINRILDRLDRSEQRFNSSIGALGARWGLHSEESFRNGLKAILEESFDVEVIHVTEWDDEGSVFGRPDQVELDILIKNGLLIICELKSSVSKSEAYHFERKVRFYEKIHNRKCDRMIIISPMVDDRAKAVTKKLAIEVYTHSSDVRV